MNVSSRPGYDWSTQTCFQLAQWLLVVMQLKVPLRPKKHFPPNFINTEKMTVKLSTEHLGLPTSLIKTLYYEFLINEGFILVKLS